MLLFTLNLGIALLDFGGGRANLIALNVVGEVGGLDSSEATGPL